MRPSLDTHGGIVKGGGYAPLHVQSLPKWELFRKFPFWRFKLSTLCRQLEVPRLSRGTSFSIGEGLYYFQIEIFKVLWPELCHTSLKPLTIYLHYALRPSPRLAQLKSRNPFSSFLFESSITSAHSASFFPLHCSLFPFLSSSVLVATLSQKARSCSTKSSVGRCSRISSSICMREMTSI